MSARAKKRIGAGLAVLGTFLAVLAIFGVWAQRQILENDKWVETSEQLLQSDAVRAALSNYLVDELYANVDVEAELAAALPPRLQPLAGPAANQLRDVAVRSADRLLASPRALKAWRRANGAAHRQFIDVVKDEGDVVGTGGGEVRLNLQQLLVEVGGRAGVADKLAGKLPPEAASLLIMQSDQLETAQEIVNALRPIAWILLLLSLASFGGAIALAGDRRRALLTAGLCVVLAGVTVLALRRLGGNLIVDNLANPASEDAVKDVWRIGTSLLANAAQGAVLFGGLVALGAWSAGPARAAVATRRTLAPTLRERPAISFVVLGVALLALVGWGPVPWTQKVIPVLIFSAAAFAGLEYLRRQTDREFPAAPG
jgi:hypothetical protein